MGDFRKRNLSCCPISRERISCKEIPGERNILYLKKNEHLSWLIILEKILHRCRSGKQILSSEIWCKQFLPKRNHPTKSAR